MRSLLLALSPSPCLGNQYQPGREDKKKAKEMGIVQTPWFFLTLVTCPSINFQDLWRVPPAGAGRTSQKRPAKRNVCGCGTVDVELWMWKNHVPCPQKKPAPLRSWRRNQQQRHVQLRRKAYQARFGGPVLMLVNSSSKVVAWFACRQDQLKRRRMKSSWISMRRYCSSGAANWGIGQTAKFQVL